MNAYTSFEQAAIQHGSRTAIEYLDTKLSYAELRNLALRASTMLLELAVVSGNRVAIILPNVPAYVVAYYGVLRLGAVVVSVNYDAGSAELASVLADCQPAVLFCTQDIIDRSPAHGEWKAAIILVDEQDSLEWLEPQEVIRDDGVVAKGANEPAAILYTSGTTGASKGVVLSHGNTSFNSLTHHRICSLVPEDRLLLFLPLYHCFGQNAAMSSMLSRGGCLILQKRFTLPDIIHAIVYEKISVVFAVPPVFSALLTTLSSDAGRAVRFWYSAAAPLSGDLAASWLQHFGTPIAQGYGLTETSPIAAYSSGSDALTKTSVGRPVPQVDIRVVNEDGGVVDSDGIGEIAIRGPNVMLGYWNRPEDTRHALRDGWFRTGDLGRIDPAGYLYLTDRKKDVIITGGRKVLPSEVEAALASHWAVKEVAVVGLGEATMGERVVAQVVTRAGAKVSPGELRQYVARQLASYKVPGTIDLVDDIPRNRAGKVSKQSIREYYRRQTPVAGPGSTREISRTELHDWILNWIRTVTGDNQLNVNQRAPFVERGVTSALAVQLAVELGLWLGRPLAATTVWNYPTIEALSTALSSQDCNAPMARS